MHDDIKTFTTEGIVADEADILENRTTLVEWTEGQMRDDGYAPVLDLDPQYTIEYVPEQEHFKFTLSVYGTFVGEEQAWLVAGMMHGKRIMRSIPQAKLKEFWVSAESK